jgi:transcriptional regulator with XRE-family HTH domain
VHFRTLLKILAENARTFRLAAARTQEDIAHHAGLTVRAYAGIERAQTGNPSLASVHAIAETLGIDLADLLTRREGGPTHERVGMPGVHGHLQVEERKPGLFTGGLVQPALSVKDLVDVALHPGVSLKQRVDRGPEGGVVPEVPGVDPRGRRPGHGSTTSREGSD